MPLPVEGPTTPAQVKAWAGVTDARLDALIDDICAAVKEMVDTLPIVADIDPVPDAYPARVVQGSTMLAARILKRRNSIDGVQALTDEGASYVSRSDPDVAQLLQIGAYGKPAVG